LFGGRGSAASAEGFDTAVDGGGGFAGDGLVCDGFKESFVRGLHGIPVHLEGDGFRDEALQTFVVFSEVIVGCGQIKAWSGSWHGRNRVGQDGRKKKAERIDAEDPETRSEDNGGLEAMGRERSAV
jgi:hypothetical protein